MPDVRMPDGTVMRNVPANATRAQIQAAYEKARQAGRVEDKRPKSFWQGVAEGFHPVAQNFDRIASNINPLMLAADALGLVDTAGTRKKVDARFQQNQASTSSRGSTLGKITGGVVGTLPTLMVPGGPVLQGVLGGALMNEDGTLKGVARDAVIGGVGGKVGGMFGKRVVAPVAERIGRTAPARAVSKAVVNVTNKLLPGNVSQLPLPRFTPTDKAVNRMAPDIASARQVAADAARLKLPVAMADVDPRLQQLAGSVARHAPDARALAEQALNTRARGQAGRAVSAIDEHLAPVTDIRARGEQIMAGGADEYKPLYDAAYASPPISSPRLGEVLATPAGRSATSRANTIAANEFRDPKQLGFVLDKNGQVVLDPASVALGADEAGNMVVSQAPLREPGYSTQSLDYVKRGLDDLLEPYRNPISGKLVLDESGRAISGVKNSLVSELDNLNPDYAAARASYQKFARQREALNTGHDVLPNGSLPQRDFDSIVSRATPDTMPELQRGYATKMADSANRQRLSGNPYESIYGGTDQQAKIGALFPEGAPDFGRVYDLESLMAQTRTKALGGSQTQANKAADDLFQNDAANMAVDGALQAVTGGGIPGATKLVGMFGRKVLGSRDLGVLGAEKKANAIAPMLFDTSNPAAITDFLDELARKRLEQEVRRNAYQNAGSTLGQALGVAPAVAVGGAFGQ